MKKKILLFTCLSIFNLSSHSQDSLKYYLDLAAKNNPAVLQKLAEYKAALQKVPQVGSLPDPDINVGVFLSPMEQLSGNQAADIRLMQMFPWFGVLKNAKDEMSLMAKSKFELYRDTKLQVGYDLQRSWYELHKIRQNIRFSERNLSLLRMLERLATAKFQSVPSGNSAAASGNGSFKAPVSNQPTGSSGMNTMGNNPSGAQPASPMAGNAMGTNAAASGLAEIYRIQLEINDLQNNLESLKEQWKTSSAQFNSLLNRSQNDPVTIPDTLVAGTFLTSRMALTDSILHNNPMLEMLRYEEQSLESRKLMVTRMGYPMIGLGVNYSLINKSEMSTSAMNGKDMIMPMVTVTLPIYRKKYKALQAEAALLKTANTQNIKSTANALQAESFQANQAFLDAERRVKLYRNQYDLASRTTDILVKGFASSGTGLSDILRVRQQMFDYGYRQMEALADENIAIAWLRRLGNLEMP